MKKISLISISVAVMALISIFTTPFASASTLIRTQLSTPKILVQIPRQRGGIGISTKLTVQDTGIGIPGKNIKFYDLSNTIICYAVTDTNGNASCNNVYIKPTQDVEVYFAGDSMYMYAYSEMYT